ncbi:MAG: ABC transporter permease, partial [Quisquiliibacterium sp.]
MYRYILKRLLLVFPTLFGSAILVFTLLRLVPGDTCELRIAGSGSYFDQSALDACRHDLGLDKPKLEQFGEFVWGMVRFDFGNSMWTGQPIVSEVARRFELSLEIAILATIVAIMVSVPLGT